MSASSLLSRTSGGGCFRLVVLGKEEPEEEESDEAEEQPEAEEFEARSNCDCNL